MSFITTYMLFIALFICYEEEKKVKFFEKNLIKYDYSKYLFSIIAILKLKSKCLDSNKVCNFDINKSLSCIKFETLNKIIVRNDALIQSKRGHSRL